MFRRRLTERLSVPGLRFAGKLPLTSVPALVFMLVIIVGAILAPALSPYDPLASGPPVQPPGPDLWFVSDANGRDIFARILSGARWSLQLGLAATVAAAVGAAVIGSIAARGGKVVSEIVMRFMDIIMSFPGIALAA